MSSSTSFLPRSLWTRGGSESTRSPFRAVLQVPRSCTAKSGVGDSKNNNNNGESGENIKTIKKSVTINGSGTGTNGVDTKSKNGSSKKNGSSNTNGSSKKNGFVFVDDAIPAAFVAEMNLPADVG